MKAIVGAMLVLAFGTAAAVSGATASSAAPSPAVTYADGLVVSLASVETMPATDAATCTDAGICRPGEMPGHRLVRATVSLSLPASAPSAISLDVVAGTASGIGLTARGRVAAIDCGNMTETTLLCTDLAASVPTEVAPGATVLLSESFDVPVDDLDALVVTVQPPVSDATGSNPLRPATFPAAAS